MIRRTVLITGATQGLGRGIAHDLAARGHTVLLHGRDRTRLEEVATELRATTRDVEVRTYLADLSDLRQVHEMASRIREAEPRLDVLVNNAVANGGSQPLRKRWLSAQGHELQFAVNHLAAYALARDLLPLLTASAPARIVNVASTGRNPIDFDDVMLERNYELMPAYRRSKLAMIMATFDLAEELESSRVTVNALIPALGMGTQVVREAGIPVTTSIDEGVRPTVRLISDPALESTTGRFFDQFTEITAHEQAYDVEARRRLMELTRELIG
ncbi:SDR family NAD(P)-dependent oxidoreductase [Streptomyces sp. NPDC041068]|uniref:SDR family NAD(P)-dependent oxidoreductase n=1 Tax=Streptomyces sp. NPDC041068 TaxID=3155130 RepID=UPI0033FC6C05